MVTNNWLDIVSNFLGCSVSDLDPNKIYLATVILLAVIFASFAHVLARSGRR